MAKFEDGVLGRTSGRIGSIVIQGTCNGKSVREYVEPANPRTPKQVAQRERFKAASRLARGFLPLAIQGLKLRPEGSNRFAAVTKGIMLGLLARDTWPAIQPVAVPYADGDLPMPAPRLSAGRMEWDVDPARTGDTALIALVDSDGELTTSDANTMAAGGFDLPSGFHGVAMLAFCNATDASPVAHLEV